MKTTRTAGIVAAARMVAHQLLGKEASASAIDACALDVLAAELEHSASAGFVRAAPPPDTWRKRA